jgi:ankyrin repeat protein
MKDVLSQEVINDFVNSAHSNLDAVKAALEIHPELLNAKSSQNETAIQAASHLGRRKIAEYLLEKGAPLDICTAAVFGYADKVSAMLKADPALSAATGAHQIPVMFFAALGGNLTIMEILFNHGANLNAGDGTNTALHAAVVTNRADLTEWLLDHGARLDLKSFDGKTPLEMAVEFKRPQAEEVIRKHMS